VFLRFVDFVSHLVGSQVGGTYFESSSEMADLIECSVTDDVKEFVIAAAQHVNKTSGTSYHVSDVMSCEDAGEGGKKLKLVMVRHPRDQREPR
jgi:hypothetical protein